MLLRKRARARQAKRLTLRRRRRMMESDHAKRDTRGEKEGDGNGDSDSDGDDLEPFSRVTLYRVPDAECPPTPVLFKTSPLKRSSTVSDEQITDKSSGSGVSEADNQVESHCDAPPPSRNLGNIRRKIQPCLFSPAGGQTLTTGEASTTPITSEGNPPKKRIITTTATTTSSKNDKLHHQAAGQPNRTEEDTSTNANNQREPISPASSTVTDPDRTIDASDLRTHGVSPAKMVSSNARLQPHQFEEVLSIMETKANNLLEYEQTNNRSILHLDWAAGNPDDPANEGKKPKKGKGKAVATTDTASVSASASTSQFAQGTSRTPLGSRNVAAATQWTKALFFGDWVHEYGDGGGGRSFFVEVQVKRVSGADEALLRACGVNPACVWLALDPEAGPVAAPATLELLERMERGDSTYHHQGGGGRGDASRDGSLASATPSTVGGNLPRSRTEAHIRPLPPPPPPALPRMYVRDPDMEDSNYRDHGADDDDYHDDDDDDPMSQPMPEERLRVGSAWIATHPGIDYMELDEDEPRRLISATSAGNAQDNERAAAAGADAIAASMGEVPRGNEVGSESSPPHFVSRLTSIIRDAIRNRDQRLREEEDAQMSSGGQPGGQTDSPTVDPPSKDDITSIGDSENMDDSADTGTTTSSPILRPLTLPLDPALRELGRRSFIYIVRVVAIPAVAGSNTFTGPAIPERHGSLLGSGGWVVPPLEERVRRARQTLTRCGNEDPRLGHHQDEYNGDQRMYDKQHQQQEQFEPDGRRSRFSHDRRAQHHDLQYQLPTDNPTPSPITTLACPAMDVKFDHTGLCAIGQGSNYNAARLSGFGSGRLHGEPAPLWHEPADPTLEDVYWLVWHLIAGTEFLGFREGLGFGGPRGAASLALLREELRVLGGQAELREQIEDEYRQTRRALQEALLARNPFMSPSAEVLRGSAEILADAEGVFEED